MGAASLIVKIHPHDAERTGRIGFELTTNADLRSADVTPYELFGVADLIVTDFSSIALERQYLSLKISIIAPDYEAFSMGSRGLRPQS